MITTPSRLNISGNGKLISNGEDNKASSSLGAGSGGSVSLTVSSLVGDGQISCRGGNTWGTGGGGGGGRVSIQVGIG
jgi:hypothetical protein